MRWVLIAAVVGAGSAAGSTVIDRVVATVDDHPITAHALERRVARMRVKWPSADPGQLQTAAADDEAEDWLMLREAAQTGLPSSEAELDWWVDTFCAASDLPRGYVFEQLNKQGYDPNHWLRVQQAVEWVARHRTPENSPVLTRHDQPWLNKADAMIRRGLRMSATLVHAAAATASEAAAPDAGIEQVLVVGGAPSEQLKSKAGARLDASLVQADLESLSKERWLKDAVARTEPVPSRPGDVWLTYQLTPYAPLEDVVLEGAPPYVVAAFAESLPPAVPAHPYLLHLIAEGARNEFRTRGDAIVSIVSTVETLPSGGARLRLKIEPGTVRKVSEVRVEGADAALSNELLALATNLRKHPYVPEEADDVVRQLRDACFDRGLIRATVSLYVEPSSKVHRPDLVELVFRVEPGAPYKVSSVKLRGLPAAAETLKLRLKAGQGYARKELLADVAQLEAVLKKVHAPGPVQVDSVIDDEAKTIDVAYVLGR